MELSLLIPSETRLKILRHFCLEEETGPVHVNELARLLALSPQPAHRELLRLETWGFLLSQKTGNLRQFRLNKKFPYFKPLCEIFTLEKNLSDTAPQSIKEYSLDRAITRKSRVKISVELLRALSQKNTKPRSYDEEVFLKNQDTKSRA